MASDRNVLFVIDKAHRDPVESLQGEFDLSVGRIPPHILLVYPEEGSQVSAVAVSRTAGTAFRSLIRFDTVKIVGERNVWLMPDADSAEFLESLRKPMHPEKITPRMVLGRGKDRQDAERIRDRAIAVLRPPVVLEFSEILHQEILVDGSLRQVARFPLRQDSLVQQAMRAARWNWSAWPLGGESPFDAARTAWRLMAHLVPFEDETIRDSVWKDVRQPDEPLDRFSARETSSRGLRALAVLRWDPREKRRYVQVLAHSLPSGSRAADAAPLVDEMRAAFAESGASAIRFPLWGDRRGDAMPGDLWHLDAVDTLGPLPEASAAEVPAGLECVKESTVEFMEDYRRLHADHRDAHPNIAEYADADMMRANLRTGGVISLREGGATVGLVGWQLAEAPHWDVPAHTVDDVIVAGGRRGKGIGRALRALAAREMDRSKAVWQAGRIHAYNAPALSGALAAGRSIVATSVWVDLSDRQGWRRHSLDA